MASMSEPWKYSLKDRSTYPNVLHRWHQCWNRCRDLEVHSAAEWIADGLCYTHMDQRPVQKLRVGQARSQVHLSWKDLKLCASEHALALRPRPVFSRYMAKTWPFMTHLWQTSRKARGQKRVCVMATCTETVEASDESRLQGDDAWHE